MRLFAAVRPPADVLAHLELALEAARAALPPADAGALRWTAPQDRHLTLAFYGEVPDGAVEDLEAVLAGAAAGAEPLRLELRGAGAFDRRTVWVGCGGDASGLASLMAASAAAGGDVTGRTDRERSRAHLTIARVRDRARARRPGRGRPVDPAADLVRALSVYTGPAWDARDLVLVASHLGQGRGGAPRYDDVAVLPLGGASGTPAPAVGAGRAGVPVAPSSADGPVAG